MTELHDLLLPHPLPEPAMRGLLFFGFTLHLAFVLLMLGSAMMGLSYLFRAWATDDSRAWRLSGSFLKPFFVLKSVAIVLGIAPLLLIQVGYTVPFMTAGKLFAPVWMGIVALLLTALFALEYCIEHNGRRSAGLLLSAIIGGVCLLAVAGVFVLVLVTTENPPWWNEAARSGGQLPAAGSVHWLLRLGHVYGAAVVLAAVFHLALAPSSAREKREVLMRWLMGGVLFQFVVGLALFASLPRPPGWLVTALVLTGASVAAALLWTVRPTRAGPRWRRSLLGTGALLLILMLVARQLLQERVLLPVSTQLARNAKVHRLRLQAAAAQSGHTSPVVVSRDSPAGMYLQSCKPCHGGVANGQGVEAPRLKVPPENLNAMRITPAELRRILLQGVPGTAMPRFGFYTRDELNGLRNFLLAHTGFRHQTEAFSPPANAEANVTAGRIFEERCVACHGVDGTGTRLGLTLVPPVPDLTQLTLTPARMFEVITTGYPGTLMPSFANHPDDVRWELVRMARNFYRISKASGTTEPKPPRVSSSSQPVVFRCAPPQRSSDNL